MITGSIKSDNPLTGTKTSINGVCTGSDREILNVEARYSLKRPNVNKKTTETVVITITTLTANTHYDRLKPVLKYVKPSGWTKSYAHFETTNESIE